jgi:hypothetical protein
MTLSTVSISTTHSLVEQMNTIDKKLGFIHSKMVRIPASSVNASEKEQIKQLYVRLVQQRMKLKSLMI